MASIVNKDTVKLLSGIDLPNTVIVQGGVDGAFFPANQIGWGDSTFDSYTFGGTSQGLLNAVETSIKTTAAKVSNAVLEITSNLQTRDNELADMFNSYQPKGDYVTNTQAEEMLSTKVFIGTQEEYQIAKQNNKISVGALVIIMEEGEDVNDTIALLGTAVLGKMLLGQK